MKMNAKKITLVLAFIADVGGLCFAQTNQHWCCRPPGIDSNVNGTIWPGGRVLYEFDGQVTASQQAAMVSAMKEWENVSPVRFIPRNSEINYIYIKPVPPPNNWSFVGMIGNKQELGISAWDSKFIMAHELCHALGFDHEHQRPDRDLFVTIIPSMINDPNYRIENKALIFCDYDFDSIMHYPEDGNISLNSPYSGAWKARIGQTSHLSVGDIRGVQIAYGQPNRPPAWYGFAGNASGFTPTFHTEGEFATIGNKNFRLISENLKGGSGGILYLSSQYDSIAISGLSLYVNPLFGFPLFCSANGSSGVAGVGLAAIPIPVSNEPSLIKSNFFLQAVFVDNYSPLSFGHTTGLWMTIINTVPIETQVLYDRVKYKTHFSGATSAGADQLGRAIWNVKQVSGFTYVKTEQFSCGGQSHWMVIVRHAQSGIEFCLIPGGSFRMGDVTGKGYSDELPVHYVRLSPFLMARTEVTQNQFTKVMNTSPWAGRMFVQIGPNNAASYINWIDSSIFCVNSGLRLPSEAEWEYSCRAGVSTCYHYGENYPPTRNLLDSYAWWYLNSTSVKQQYAHQVAQKLPNSFGLYDTHGNVWEWCEDCWHINYQGAPINGNSWPLGGNQYHLNRGGCFDDLSVSIRSARRNANFPNITGLNMGFRPACSLP